MQVRRYSAADFAQVAAWGAQWGASYDSDLLPPVGFIWPGVAAYFVYEPVGCSVVWLENLVTNQQAPAQLRQLAIEAVISAALAYVASTGRKVAYASTNLQAVVDRAVVHGAHSEPGQTLLTLKFK